jgi:hypothetical protein
MSAANLIWRLKETEEEFEEASMPLQQDQKLYLTEEDWDARRRKHEMENHSSGGTGGGDVGKDRGRSRGRGCSGSSFGGLSNKLTSDVCQRCGKMGHWARECRSKLKKEQTHITQDEDEGLLLLMTPTLTRPKASSTLRSTVEASSFGAEIELKEEKVYAHLDKEKECDVGT